MENEQTFSGNDKFFVYIDYLVDIYYNIPNHIYIYLNSISLFNNK